LEALPLLQLEQVDEFSVVLKKHENETQIVALENNFSVPFLTMFGFDRSLIIEEHPSID